MTKHTQTETSILRIWKSRIALLMAIVTPTAGVVGAYYKLKLERADDKAEMNTRISAVELTATQSFAEKQDLKDMQRDISKLRDDVTEIKTLLKRR